MEVSSSVTKDNHIATVHLPQMLYIWPAIVFFSWPALLPLFSDLTIFRQRLPRVTSTVIAIAIMSAVVNLNTVIHPFTLADNRHYTFYVFAILRKQLADQVHRRSSLLCLRLLGPRRTWWHCEYHVTSTQRPPHPPRWGHCMRQLRDCLAHRHVSLLDRGPSRRTSLFPDPMASPGGSPCQNTLHRPRNVGDGYHLSKRRFLAIAPENQRRSHYSRSSDPLRHMPAGWNWAGIFLSIWSHVTCSCTEDLSGLRSREMSNGSCGDVFWY